MVATSGAQLLPDEAVSNMLKILLPLTTILTPNIPEARLLLKYAGEDVPEIKSVQDIVHIAALLLTLGPKYVLVKGGHLPFDENLRVSAQGSDRRAVIDVLHSSEYSEPIVFRTEYSQSKNTHGTGCSLACKISPPVLRTEHVSAPLNGANYPVWFC